MKRLVSVAVLVALTVAASIIARVQLSFGMRIFQPDELAKAAASNRPINAIVFGTGEFSGDVSTAQAAAGIGTLRVFGLLRISPQLRAALAGRAIVAGTVLDA